MSAQTDFQKSIEAQNGFRFFNPLITNRLKAHFVNREHMTQDEIKDEFNIIELEQMLSLHYCLILNDILL